MSGGGATRPPPDVLRAAAEVGAHWRNSPYHREAEAFAAEQWAWLVEPFLADAVDFSRTLDLAAGQGRNAARLLPRARELWLVDILAENIAACRARFGADPRLRYHVNDGASLPCVPHAALTLVFCFDSMVHFDSDVVRAYLHEFARVLAPGGHAFLHHSNHAANPGGDYRDSPAWRNFMTRELMAHWAAKAGLEVVRQQPVDWLGDGGALDCLTLLRAPGIADDAGRGSTALPPEQGSAA